MKKFVSLICSLALLLAVCVPAYAADATAPTANDFAGSITVGNYTYSLSSNEQSAVVAYLMQLNTKGVLLQDIDSAITTVKDAITAAHSQYPTYGPAELWNAVQLSKNFSPIKSNLKITNVSFNNLTLSVTDSFHIDPTFTISSSYSAPSAPKDKDDKDDNETDTSKSTTPSAPSNTQTTTATGADGRTTVGVTTAPDSTPTVSGGTSSFDVTVPNTAVSTAVSSATAAKHAAVTISAPSAALISQLNSATVQKVDMSLKVPSGVAYGTAANVDVAMNLDSSVLQAAKQTAKDVTVSVVDQLTGKEAYSWTFKGADLANAASIGSINMALNVKTSTLDSEVAGKIPASQKGVVLTFANNGALPAPATVKVLVSDQGYQPGQTIHMYYYNSARNQVEKLANSVYKVDAEGYVSVTVDHNSKYILSSGEIAAVNPVQLDTGKKLSVKKGKTYQFKITATAKPTFTSGNSSVFTVAANGVKGNNYFFTVTAVGKAGQSTGFYVNGEKTPRTVGTIA
jgi:hypothetical protein